MTAVILACMVVPVLWGLLLQLWNIAASLRGIESSLRRLASPGPAASEPPSSR